MAGGACQRADDDRGRDATSPASCAQNITLESVRARAAPRADEVGDPPDEARAEREHDARHREASVVDRPGRGDRVELVRVVEDGRLGRPRRACVVVAGDAVEQLGARLAVEPVGALLDQAQPEMDVAEQPSLLGLAERRAAAELERAADVVQERGGEQEVGAEPRMELRGLAAERRDADRVLEQAAGVGVVPVRASPGSAAQPPRTPSSREEARPSRARPGMRDLGRQELEEAVELVGVAAHRRREGRRGRSPARPRACARRAGAGRGTAPRGRARAPRRPRRSAPSSSSTSFQTRASMRPLGSTSSSARYGAPPFVRSRCLRLDGEDALDDAVLGQLGDAAHAASLGAARLLGSGRGRRQAVSRAPLRRARRPARARRAALRRDLTPTSATRYLARDPHNIVHLTLPDSRGRGGAHARAPGAREGVLVRGDEPALWWLAQDFVGPDGVARTREGIVASLRVEPYDGAGRPAARAHARRPEGGAAAPAARRRARSSSRSSSSTTADAAQGAGASRCSRSTRAACATRLWRAERPGGDRGGRGRADPAQLLIADGHHRYETALAFTPRRGLPRSGFMMVVLVATEQDGLTIFPTHRIAESRANLLGGGPSDPSEALACGRGAAAGPGRGRRLHARASARRHRRGGRARRRARRAARARRRLVHAVPPTRRSRRSTAARRTRRSCSARRRRRAGLRRRRGRGETMPQKSTYFYPKLTSGLLFHPLVDRLARALPRRGRGRRAPCSASCPTRAEREPVARQGKGGDDTTAIDEAAEQAVRRAASTASSGVDARLRGDRRSSATGAAAGRRRPDRRLAERQARDPVLLALDRGRGGRDDGRRPLRLRLRLRLRRGVDGRAGRRRLARTASRSTASRRRTTIEILSLRGDADRARRRAGAGRSSGSPTGCGSWARWRSRSATSPPAGSTPSARSRRARSVDIAAAQLLVRERGLRDRAVRGAAVRRRAARSRGALARRRRRDAGALRAGSRMRCSSRKIGLACGL